MQEVAWWVNPAEFAEPMFPPHCAWRRQVRSQWARRNAVFHAVHVFAAGSWRSQSSVAQGKSWDANMLAEAMVSSCLSDIGRLACTRMLRAFSSLMMYLRIPSQLA